MDAGGVYHLLAQARPVEDPICPRLSEECGAEAPWDVLATGTQRMASESITWHHLCRHYLRLRQLNARSNEGTFIMAILLACPRRAPPGWARRMTQLKRSRLLEVDQQSMWSWKAACLLWRNAENARRVSCPESLTEVHRRQEVLTSVEAAGIQGCTTSRHLSDR